MIQLVPQLKPTQPVDTRSTARLETQAQFHNKMTLGASDISGGALATVQASNSNEKHV